MSRSQIRTCWAWVFGGNARPDGAVAIRDSKNPEREPLRYTAEEWQAFRKGVIDGAL